MYYSTCMADRVRQSCFISCTMHMGLFPLNQCYRWRFTLDQSTVKAECHCAVQVYLADDLSICVMRSAGQVDGRY